MFFTYILWWIWYVDASLARLSCVRSWNICKSNDSFPSDLKRNMKNGTKCRWSSGVSSLLVTVVWPRRFGLSCGIFPTNNNTGSACCWLIFFFYLKRFLGCTTRRDGWKGDTITTHTVLLRSKAAMLKSIKKLMQSEQGEREAHWETVGQAEPQFPRSVVHLHPVPDPGDSQSPGPTFGLMTTPTRCTTTWSDPWWTRSNTSPTSPMMSSAFASSSCWMILVEREQRQMVKAGANRECSPLLLARHLNLNVADRSGLLWDGLHEAHHRADWAALVRGRLFHSGAIPFSSTSFLFYIFSTDIVVQEKNTQKSSQHLKDSNRVRPCCALSPPDGSAGQQRGLPRDGRRSPEAGRKTVRPVPRYSRSVRHISCQQSLPGA